jgi:hypothetical protein
MKKILLIAVTLVIYLSSFAQDGPKYNRQNKGLQIYRTAYPSLYLDGANPSILLGDSVTVIPIATKELKINEDTILTSVYKAMIDTTVLKVTDTIESNEVILLIEDSGTSYLTPLQVAAKIYEDSKNDVVDAIQYMGGAVKSVTTWTDPIPRSSGALLDRRINFSAIYIRSTEDSLTGVWYAQSVTGNYTADNNNRIGLYKTDGDSIRLVASSANNGDLWKAADSVFVQVAFSAKYLPEAAGIYYIGYLYNQSASSTAPQVGATTTGITGLYPQTLAGTSHFGSGYIDAQTDLPAAIIRSAISQLTAIYWGALY